MEDTIDTIACGLGGRAYGDLSPPASIMLPYLNIAIPFPFLHFPSFFTQASLVNSGRAVESYS